ncbi:MAG: patatin-like phospholipase family protein [Acidobacteriota bacterium]
MPISTADRIETLRAIPLFSYLTAEELQAAQVLFQEQAYRKGEVICRMGEEGDTFYIVLSGELEVWGGSDAEPKLIGRLGPRDFFGELALVLGGPRSATVKVARRAKVLSLHKESFNRFFLHNTKVLEYFSRVICQRLAATASNQTFGEERSSSVIAVVAEPYVVGSTLVAAGVAALLRRELGGAVLLVDVTTVARGQKLSGRLSSRPDRVAKAIEFHGDDTPATLRVVVEDEVANVLQSDRFAALVTRLCRDFEAVVLDIGAQPHSLVRAVADYADSVVRLVETPGLGASADVQTFEVVNLYNRGTRRVPINSCEPFVLPKDPALVDGGEPLAIGVAIAGAPRSPAGLPLARLVRKILGRTVGVALGGGAAFGLAHLGVLKVFEEHDVPIDVLAGCSMGSLVAVGYGAGLDLDHLESLATELGSRTRLLDLVRRDATLTRPGLLTGRAIRDIFGPLLGEKRTFRHLTIPCRAVATDIETGERVSIGTGRLDEAFRASCAVPVVMSPVRRDHRVLVDGGVCDPVPADVVRDMGADVTVAVNVVPPLKKGVEMLPSRIYRRLSFLNPMAYVGQSLDLPNLFDIVMSSMQTLQYELGNYRAISADFRINPDLSDFTWVEFYRAQELIAQGAEAARRAVPAISRALGR